MKPDKPVNQFAHLVIGLLAAIVLAFFVHAFALPRFAYFIVATGAFYVITLLYEYRQYSESNLADYWEHKWLDAILDIVAGNLGFAGLLWLIYWTS